MSNLDKLYRKITKRATHSSSSVDEKFVHDFVTSRERNLRAYGKWMKNLDRYRKTMTAAITADTRSFFPGTPITGSYGDYNADVVTRWLKKWKGIEVMPAREGSVALYIHASVQAKEKIQGSAERDLGAEAVEPDEIEWLKGWKGRKNVIRLWWD